MIPFTNHNPDGLWSVEIFTYKCGRRKTVAIFRSDSISDLIEYGSSITDDVEIFFEIKPDENQLARKHKERDAAYRQPKDCWDHGPITDGVCTECKVEKIGS